MKKLLAGVFVLLLTAACSINTAVNAPKPKYIFLFIGDGMAAPQRMTAEEFSRKNNLGKLAMNTMPVHASTRTGSANSLITDSAASATAIACGVKTNNGMIGMLPDGSKVTSAAEIARDKGKKIGIITTVTLNHATPAGFYGHRRSRSQYYDLGLDMIASGFDFFGGGGIAHHNKGETDIYILAEKSGYKIVQGKDGLNSLSPGQKAIALAESKSNIMPYSIDSRHTDNIPSLADLTSKAIELLDNPNGFFIMVEGGSIDLAGHSNDAATNLHEVLYLDNAIKKAIEFYHKHPAETLIIVTGDHETGGMTMGSSAGGYALNMDRLANQKHSAAKFAAIFNAAKKANPEMTFEDVKPLLTENYGFKFSGDPKKDPMVLSPAEIEKLESGFKKNILPHIANLTMSNKAGIGWSSSSHTALPVLTTSMGCASQLFSGFFENSDIANKLKTIL